MKPASQVIDVNFEELEALLARARQGPLGEEDYGKLEAAIHTLNYLINLIGEKETTISRLRALLVKPSTEKTRKVLEQAGLPTLRPAVVHLRTGMKATARRKNRDTVVTGRRRIGARSGSKWCMLVSFGSWLPLYEGSRGNSKASTPPDSWPIRRCVSAPR